MGVAAPITAQAVINQAASQIGTTEVPFGSNKQPYGFWYGANGQPWCAMFVSWCLHHAGWDSFAVTTDKGYAYCPYGVDFFKSHSAWASADTVPKPGWVVFFDFPGDGVNRVSHTGLVEGVLADGRVATIEGNTNPAGGRTGGEVMRHNRTKAGGIAGFGIVDYVGVTPGPAPAPTPSGTVLKLGSTGSGVSHVQDRLNAHSVNDGRLKVSVDGQFGPGTQAAVKVFQADVGLTADGEVGPKTLAALDTVPNRPAPPPPPPPARATIRLGATGSDVRYLQGRLRLAVDGQFGPKTDAAVKAFQRTHGLGADGIVGPRTWAVLG